MRARPVCRQLPPGGPLTIILTWSGKRFNLLDPQPEDVSIFDIARSLANICRFTGHTSRFFSVAEHCVRVSKMVPEEDALYGLLHDATEAYVGDLSFPLKHQPEMQPYLDIEAKVWAAIAAKFGLPEEEPPCVKEADRETCRQEGALLIKGWDDPPHDDPYPYVRCLRPRIAQRIFLARFTELVRDRDNHGTL